MTDLVVTPANVLASGTSNLEHGVAGVAVTAGQVVYKEQATGQFKLCDSNSATLEQRIPYGIAAHASNPGQPLSVCTSGDINVGAALTPGTAYFASETPGGIEPAADLSTTENVALLGIARSASSLRLRIDNSGVVL